MLRMQWATCCQEKQFLGHLEDMADSENYKEAEYITEQVSGNQVEGWEKVDQTAEDIDQIAQKTRENKMISQAPVQQRIQEKMTAYNDKERQESRTARLWLQYMEMVELLRTFIKGWMNGATGSYILLHWNGCFRTSLPLDITCMQISLSIPN